MGYKMNDLIPLNTDDRFPVNARHLWAFLGSRRQYADWVKARLGEMAALSEQDYKVSQNCEAGNRIDYYLTLDAAKHISMMERSEKGKQARHWFIQREKELAAIEANALPGPANMTKLDWIRTALESEERAVALAAKVEELTPKAEFADHYAEADGEYSMRDVAGMLGTGRTRLYAFLRDAKVFPEYSRTPYQRHIREGHFIMAPRKVGPEGREWVEKVPKVTAKGYQYILKRWKAGITGVANAS